MCRASVASRHRCGNGPAIWDRMRACCGAAARGDGGADIRWVAAAAACILPPDYTRPAQSTARVRTQAGKRAGALRRPERTPRPPSRRCLGRCSGGWSEDIRLRCVRAREQCDGVQAEARDLRLAVAAAAAADGDCGGCRPRLRRQRLLAIAAALPTHPRWPSHREHAGGQASPARRRLSSATGVLVPSARRSRDSERHCIYPAFRIPLDTSLRCPSPQRGRTAQERERSPQQPIAHDDCPNGQQREPWQRGCGLTISRRGSESPKKKKPAANLHMHVGTAFSSFLSPVPIHPSAPRRTAELSGSPANGAAPARFAPHRQGPGCATAGASQSAPRTPSLGVTAISHPRAILDPSPARTADSLIPSRVATAATWGTLHRYRLRRIRTSRCGPDSRPPARPRAAAGSRTGRPRACLRRRKKPTDGW